MRHTNISEAILKILQSAPEPLSAQSILKILLRNLKIPANKTTIYRQLDKMKASGELLEVDFDEGSKRYELNTKTHHHHLICTNCNKIEDISFGNDLDNFEKIIEETKKFKVSRHALEFFGVCMNCQK